MSTPDKPTGRHRSCGAVHCFSSPLYGLRRYKKTDMVAMVKP
ncbi:MAG: hypothetical protein ACYDH5_15205 [Acidimicrobiales bacterium]